MAKLTELRDLLAAAQANLPATPAKAASAPVAPSRPAPPARAIAAKRTVAAAKHADGDIDLTQAFADVEKLPRVNKAAVHRPRPSPIPQQTLADERDALQAAKYGDDPAPQSWDTGQEFEQEQTFVRNGLNPDLAGKLRRGHWSVQAELDLHGLTVDEAHDALSDFIVAARARTHRCVRVIHGKGLTSPNREPVLKGRVRLWLAHWGDVLAYCETPANAGGGGAVLVLLRGR